MDEKRTHRLHELNEGRRNRMYLDSLGYESIGIGHNLRDKPISDRAIDVIYEDDLAEVLADLDRELPWWRNEDDVRQAALTDLCFNLGVTKLLKFKSTLAAWQAGVHESAAIGLENSKWFTQVGVRGPRIVEMVRTGRWPQEIDS